MTKIEEIEQKLNELERELKNTVNAIEENIGNEIDNLRGALVELKESKKEGKWKPKECDEIWFRNMTGKASYLYYQEGIDIKSNLVFPTKEECERYWHFMDTVKEKSYEFSKEEWEDGDVSKWRIDYEAERFITSEWCSMRVIGGIYFKSRNDAQYIIDNFKEELMEYWI